MSNISFAPGRGTKFITWSGARIDDATATKQPVNGRTGIVVLASDRHAYRYYHSDVESRLGRHTAAERSCGLSATAASPTRINLSWSASTDNVGVKSYTVYRDGTSLGSTTSTSFADTAAAPDNTYAYRVDAVDEAGNRSAKSAAAS
jgi:hypothetical protein